MREHLSYNCKKISDREHRELKPDEILEIFKSDYLNVRSDITISDFEF